MVYKPTIIHQKNLFFFSRFDIPGASWCLSAVESLQTGLPQSNVFLLQTRRPGSPRRRPHMWVLRVQLGLHAESAPALPGPPRREEALQVQRLLLFHLQQVRKNFCSVGTDGIINNARSLSTCVAVIPSSCTLKPVTTTTTTMHRKSFPMTCAVLSACTTPNTRATW